METKDMTNEIKFFNNGFIRIEKLNQVSNSEFIFKIWFLKEERGQWGGRKVGGIKWHDMCNKTAKNFEDAYEKYKY